MKIRLTDIFDAYDGGLPELAEDSPVSVGRVKMLTLKKLHIRPRRRVWRTALIAAAAVLLLSASVFAVKIAGIQSGCQVVDVCNRQLDLLRRAGIITADFSVNSGTSHIELINETDWWETLSRDYEPFYLVRFRSGKYSGTLCVNTATYKLTQLALGASPDKSDTPVRVSGSLSWYDNFDDIFDTSMTVDTLCRKLCDYWGFDGYTVQSGDGSALLTAMDSNWQQALTTVIFDGDIPGSLQYIETDIFCSGANLMIGFDHSRG